jgi:UDP-N-acetylglucosamine diphosphorylase/glucosamine-1-phosphate N-acetyltransferase
MKQAVVLAAGEGQRLRPFTVSRPKAMLAVADKPVLHYVLEALAGNGIRDVIIVVGYRKEQVYDYFGAGEELGLDIRYVVQDHPLGTAHALKQAEGLADNTFVVVPGDNLVTAATLKGIVNGAVPAVLVKRVADPSRYGVATLDDGGITRIQEKPPVAETNLASTGIYLFDKDVFRYAGDVLDIPDAINGMINDGATVQAVMTEGRWLDIVYPEDIISLNNVILQDVRNNVSGTIEDGAVITGEVIIGGGTVIRSGTQVYGPVVIGSGCDIGPNVCIKPGSSFGDNVVVEAFSYVENSVFGNDVSLGPSSLVYNSVIGSGCVIKGRFTATGAPGLAADFAGDGETHGDVGVIMGEDCDIEANVAVEAGTVIGNGCRVRMSKNVSGRLPDKSVVY